MKKVLAFLLCFVPAPALAATGAYSDGTAYTLPKGRLEISAFQMWRYGLTNRMEIATHPVLSLVDPQVRVKVHWRSTTMWDIASRHSISYPTPLLKLIARRGTGGVLPATAEVPHLLSLHNELLATFQTTNGHLITVRAGVRNAVGFGAMDLPTLDMPVIYPRTIAWNGGMTLEGGGDLYLRSMSPFDLRLSLDLYALPEPGARFALEHRASLIWNAGPRTAVRAGYLFTFGQYPYGFAPDILPVVDLTYSFY